MQRDCVGLEGDTHGSFPTGSSMFVFSFEILDDERPVKVMGNGYEWGHTHRRKGIG